MSFARIWVALVAVVAAIAVTAPADALQTRAYSAGGVKTAIASGKEVVVHVYAPWCLQCRAQASSLSSISSAGVTVVRVDHDGQADVVKALGVSRSTIIAYKGGKEVGRMSWGTSEASVRDVLKPLL
jgi:thioredoxin-like negative regulator of GroEL